AVMGGGASDGSGSSDPGHLDRLDLPLGDNTVSGRASSRVEGEAAHGSRGVETLYAGVRLQALQEVGPSVFYSLLIIAVAFLPIFALEDQEGRLFRPLALSKTMTMAVAALLVVTLDPALRMLFTRVDRFSFRPRWLARIATVALVG